MSQRFVSGPRRWSRTWSPGPIGRFPVDVYDPAQVEPVARVTIVRQLTDEASGAKMMFDGDGLAYVPRAYGRLGVIRDDSFDVEANDDPS